MRMSRKQRRARQRRLHVESGLRTVLNKGVQLAAAAVFLWNGLTAVPAHAMPANGQVTAGSAVINQAGSVMTIQQQTAQAAINWRSFGIAAGETVHFFQPGAGAVALNRVIGSNPSAIFGQLTANGKVFLVNQNGVYFAPGAQVNVGGLVATTLSITDADFMAGRYAFASQGASGSVVNQGRIVAENQGLVALLAPEVKNEGIIVAKKGTVALAAGSRATLDFNGDGKVQLALGEGALQAAAENKGLIEADGGVVLMTARTGQNLTSSVVNQSGIVRARSLDGATGSVTLHAVDGTLQAAGTVDVSGTNAKGGSVDVFGKNITVAKDATIDASGAAGGGKVRVGGNWQGTGDAPHAKAVTVEQGAVIKADAADNGKGGAVAVWSDGTTKFDGAISAKGGDGGSVETSGHVLKVGTGKVDASAVKGKSGEWLLDPYNVTIQGSGSGSAAGGSYEPTANDSTVDVTTINTALNAGTSVTIKTGNIPDQGSSGSQEGNITVSAAISKTTGGDATLTLQAHDNILVNADIGSTTGKLNVDLDADTDNYTGGYIAINNAHISTNGGSVNLHGGNDGMYADSENAGFSGVAVNNAAIATNGGNVTIAGSTNSSADFGVNITGSTTINAGTGTVNITGRNKISTGTGINFAATTGSITAKNVTLTADKMAFSGSGKLQGDNTGTVMVKPLTVSKNIFVGASGTAGGLDLTGDLFSGDSGSVFNNFPRTVIGDSSGTGAITVNNAAFGNDVTLQTQGAVSLAGALTAVDPANSANKKNVTLIAGTDSGGSGVVTAAGLNLQGSNAAFTLGGANAVDTLAGNVKSVNFTDASGFTVGDGTNGLTIAGAAGAGNSVLTANSGSVTVQNNIDKTGSGTTDLTVNATGGTITVNANAAVKASAGKLNVNFIAGTIALANNTAKVTANGGNITLKANALSLPAGIAGGLVTSTGGVLSIDTLTPNKTIDFGGNTAGALQIASNAFGAIADPVVFGNGFKQINLGGANAGTVGITGSRVVTDPLTIKANTAITMNGGSGIDSSGDGGNALTLDAPTINFPGSGTGTLYVGTTATANAAAPKSVLTLRANAIKNWNNVQFANHGNAGTLFIQRQDNGGFAVGGSDENSALVTAAGFGKIADGNFSNVTVGTTGSGAVTVNSISALPAYTSILSGGAVNIAGTVTAVGSTLTFKAGKLTQDAGSALNVDKLLLLGGNTGDFDLSAGANNINTVAANLGGGLTLTTANDLTVGSVQDQTVIPAVPVNGITAGATGDIKLTVAKADGILTLNQPVQSGAAGTGSGNITLVTDELAFDAGGAGKVRTTGVLQLYPYTAGNPINIGSGSAAGLDIAAGKFAGGSELGGTYSKIILGRLTGSPYNDDTNQTGEINIGTAGQTTNFTSNLELRTTGTATLDGTINVGPSPNYKDLTITANKATLPPDSSLSVHNLTLNLASGLDLGTAPGGPAGTVDGTGNLTVNVPAGKDIYISNTYSGAEYKIPYTTINDVFTGFPSFGVTGDRNVYFDAGDIRKSVTVAAGGTGYGVTVRDNVNILNALSDPTGNIAKTVSITGGHFTMNTGKALTISGNNATIGITATSGDITLADAAASTDPATKLTVNGDNAVINLTASGKVDLGDYAQTAITGSGANVTVSGNEFAIGSNAVINLGTSDTGNFTLQADKLTAEDDDTPTQFTNITGKGTLKLMPLHTGKTMLVGSGTADLIVTQAQLNGDLFGSAFKDLVLGNPGGTGLVTVNGITANNNVTIQNGLGGTIAIGTGGLTVGTGYKVTLKANAIDNTNGTANGIGAITAGTGSTINLYTNNLDNLKDDNGDTVGGNPTVTGTGTLGIATYDGSVAISLGNTTHGGLYLPDSKFNTVFGSGFSAYAIGNSSQDIMYVDDSTLTKDTTLTANHIYFYPNDPNSTGNSINVGANTLTLNAAADATQSGGVITAGNLALTGGNFDLQKDNQITVLAAQAKKVEVKSTSPLTIGTVGSLSGIDTTTGGATGDIILTADQMTFSASVQGHGDLTVQQADPATTLGIGTGAGTLQLGEGLFNGTVFKDGFSHVFLGRDDGTGAVTVAGTLGFVDPTTIRSPGTGGSITVNSGSAITTSNNTLEFKTETLTTETNSTINTGSGNLTITADNLNLAGNSDPTQAPIQGSGNLILQTLTLSRDLYLGQTQNGVSTDSLFLKAGYFDGSNTERVFRDGYSKIIIGQKDGTGTLYQTGTTNFTDQVSIIQASNNSTGSVNVTGVINTGGNDFSVSSQVVNITNAQIDANHYNGSAIDYGGNVSITADTLTTDSASWIKSVGDLTIDTYTNGRTINVGGTGSGLNLSSDWFDGSHLFRKSSSTQGFSNITIGSGTSGAVTVGDLALGSGLTDTLTFKSGGDVTGTGALTNVNTLEAYAGGKVDLSNSGNAITNLGNITAGQGITVNDKDGLFIDGTVKSTGAAKNVTIHTTGDITINAGGSAQGNGDVYLVAEGGHFINNAGGSAVSTDSDSRWVIFTEDSVGDDPNGLTGDFRRYGTDYGITADLVKPDPVTNPNGTDYSGSGFAYQVQPEIWISSTRTYGDGNGSFFAGNPGYSFTADHSRDATDGAAITNVQTAAQAANSGTYFWDTIDAATNVNSTTGVTYGTGGASGYAAAYTGSNPLNYKVNVDFKITPKEVTVTAKDFSKVYDGYTYNGGAGYTYNGFIAQDLHDVSGSVTDANINAGVLGGGSVNYGTVSSDSANPNAQGARNVGIYGIGIQDSNLSAGNYTFTYVDGTLDITPRKIKVTTDNATRVYGAANPTVAGSALVNEAGYYDTLGAGDTIGSVDVSVDGSATPTANAGTTHNINVTGVTFTDPSVASNYDITYAPGTLTITKRLLIVTADDKTRVYGEDNSTAGALTYTVGAATADTGLVNGDTITGATVSLDGSVNSNSNAGTYTSVLTPGSAVFGLGNSSNYDITYNKGNFTVTPRPVLITAGDTSRVYGDPNAPFNGFTAEHGNAGTGRGLLGTDDITGVADVYDASMTPATHAGTYTGVINPVAGSQVFSGGNVNNYLFEYAPGNLEITPRPLTLTAGNASRYYGDPNPAVTAFLAETGAAGTGRGLVNGDALAVVSSLVDGSIDNYTGAGTYAGTIHPRSYTFAPGVSAGDYTVTYAPGNLTILKAPLVITADDKRRPQNADNPELTVKEYDGFKNGEDESVVSGLTLTTPADRTSLPGDYAIIPGNAVADNYEISYVNGNLTVYPAGAVDDVRTVIQPKETGVAPAVTPPAPAAPAEPAAPVNPAAVPPVNTSGVPALPSGIVGDVSVNIGGSVSQRSFVTDSDGFGLRLNTPHAGDSDVAGASRTSGAVPVLFAHGGDQTLDGIYTINYNPDKLSILPSAQKVTIPRLEEVAPSMNRDFSLIYKTEATGAFEVGFGNGIVTITPLDGTALKTVTGPNREAGRAAMATGILTAVEELGVMPDQIRAIYIYTETKINQ